MADALQHRGPDDEGYYLGEQIGLANRRLSIIDLDAGRQPIANEDETIWIVYNGEIYNYPALRRHLRDRGHRFRTQTDTEVLVHLYEEYGLQFVEQLRGMFAFALWDEPARRLVLARDPLGQKPLYYAHSETVFTFASEIKALLRVSEQAPRPNFRAIHNYISLRYVPEADTLFAGINKLPAGHLLVLDDQELSVRPYWRLQYTPKQAGSAEEIATRLRDLLLETVECHMLSDVPIGAFLSGGLDSSLVAAMMSRISDTPIRTFSIGVREQDFNELPYARMVAERYGTDHHEFIVEPNLVATLPQMIWHMEEPVDPFAFGVYSVARLASEHVKVVLGGDGGDEIFAGYDRYLGNQLVDLYRLVPAPLRRYGIEPLVERLPDNYRYNNVVQKLRWLTAMSHTADGQRYAHSACYLRFDRDHKHMLYRDALWRELGPLDSTQHLIRFYEADNARHQIDKMLYTDVKTRLAEHLLMIVDRMTMAHSIEGRSPYVDRQVVEFVASIPADLKLRGRTLKYIQRPVAAEFLPAELVQRPKRGFGFPLAYWFQNELSDFMITMFRQARLATEGYFRPDAMQSLLEEHVRGDVDHNYRLWLLLNLELWYRLFIEGTSVEALRSMLYDAGLPSITNR